MRYLTLAEALQISQRVLAPFGREPLLRDLHALESALARWLDEHIVPLQK